MTLCGTIIWLDESFCFLPPSCPSGSAIHRVAGSGKKRTHLRGGERGCLPERCHSPQDGEMPLHQAASQGHTPVVGQLLAAGAAVDAKDQVGGEWGASRGGLGGRTQLCVSS